MKVCVVQTRPIKGDIQRNIECHERLVDLAVSHGADIVIFPELSITGYEPGLANDLATDEDDCRFSSFQSISDTKEVTIGIGAPTRSSSGVSISVVLFQPHRPRQLYSKHHLHPDEEEFFVRGNGLPARIEKAEHVALAICYELSVAEHAANAFRSGARIYVASVAKSVNGFDKAISRLGEIARKYSMTVLMANCVGRSDGFQCAGKTSAWSPTGVLLGQLDDANEGLIIVDTVNGEVIDISIDETATNEVLHMEPRNRAAREEVRSGATKLSQSLQNRQPERVDE